MRDFDDELDDDVIANTPPPLVHVGYRSERTIWDSGDLERAFAFAWMERMELYGDHHLQMLLSTGDPAGDPVVTQRDATVVATLIQWLGTNCGWGFLCETLRKHGQYEIKDLEAEERLKELLSERG